MRFLLTSARKDLLRRLRDPLALAVWVGIPVALGGLMGLLGGDDGAPKAHVLLADLDGSFVSGLVGGMGSQGALAEILETEEVSLEEGRRRIADADGTALLIIPEGFGEAVLQERPVELRLITNPAQQILPAIVEEALEVLVEGAFYLQRLFGPTLKQIASGPPQGQDAFSDSTIAVVSTDINRRLERVSGLLFPPALEVETEIGASGGGAGLNFGQLFVPGLLFMALLLIAQGISDDVWTEKEAGTLRRALVTPSGAFAHFGGKLLAGTTLMAVVTVVGLAVVVGFFGVRPARVPAALVWCTYAGAVLLTYFFLIQTFATTRRGGALLTTLIVFPLMMIGGSFFPFETMPVWMRAVGRWTPNGLAVIELKEILLGDPEPGMLAAAGIGIGLPAVVAYLIALRRVRSRLVVG